ncbi:MAG TPA: hypothetical protein VJM15_04430 [Sphingomicrobium sp.]|nr:hypothetical protein [Sphingomicrobium sp.]
MTGKTAPRTVGALEHIPAETYCSAWTRLNADIAFAVREDQLHYLRMTALAMSDDLASLLLLKKLKLASRLRQGDVAPDLVEMNSFVEFRFGGGSRRFCRLLHPSICDSSFDLSIDSRLGAGIVGLRAGQELQWPDKDGFLRELTVIAVKNGELARGRWRGAPDGDDDPPPSAA